MRAPTHILAGIFTGEISAYATIVRGETPAIAAAVFAATVIGSILPDIDHPDSKISNSSAATKKASAVITSVFRHRGPIHTPAVVLLFSVLVLILLAPLGEESAACIFAGLMMGSFSHLALDTLNYAGIMWFYPLSRKRIHIIGIQTGSFWETLIRIILAVFVVMYIAKLKGIPFSDTVNGIVSGNGGT